MSRRPVPDWLAPVRTGVDSIVGEQLSRFLPPPGEPTRPGAVLMLFGDGADGPDLLLTERAHHMRSHPGQVAFPGGSQDPEDADKVATALREAQEETGLDPTGVDILGELPELWLPPSNFAVTTVLGWWAEESPVGEVDPDEVHQVLRVPIEELLDPTHRITAVHPLGRFGPGFLIGPERDLLLWGFTAGIISRFFDHIGWTRPWDEERLYDVPDQMIFGRD